MSSSHHGHQHQHQDTIDYNQQMSVGAAPGSVSHNLNTSYDNNPNTVTSSSTTTNQLITRPLSQGGGTGASRASLQPKLSTQLSHSAVVAAAVSSAAAATTNAVQRASSIRPVVVNRPMSKMASFVLHFPIPLSPVFQHERNQRFVVLYGFGANKYFEYFYFNDFI